MAKQDGDKTVKKLVSVRREMAAVDRDQVSRVLARAGDAEMNDEYMHIFDELRTSIRIFERQLKMSPSSRNVYALMALYTQMREVMADIRALTDYSEHADQIVMNVIQPLFNAITQSNLDMFYHLRQLIIEVAVDAKTQSALKRAETLMREQSRFLQSRYAFVQTEITKAVMSK